MTGADNSRRLRWNQLLSEQAPIIQFLPSMTEVSDNGIFPNIACWCFSLKQAKKSEKSIWSRYNTRSTPALLQGVQGWRLREFLATFPAILTGALTPSVSHDSTPVLLPTNGSFNELFIRMAEYVANNLRACFWPLYARQSETVATVDQWMERQLFAITDDELYELFHKFVRSSVSPDGFFTAFAMPRLRRNGYDMTFVPLGALRDYFEDPAIPVRMSIAAMEAPDHSMFYNFPKTTLMKILDLVDRWPEFTLWLKRAVTDLVADTGDIVTKVKKVRSELQKLPKVRFSVSKVVPAEVPLDAASFSTLLVPTDPFESVSMSTDSITEAQATGDLTLATNVLLWRMQSKKLFLPMISKHLHSKEVRAGSPLELRLKSLQATISTFPDTPEHVASMADVVVGNTNRPTWRQERSQWKELTESLQILVQITEDEWASQYATNLCQLRRERLRRDNPKIRDWMIENMVPELPVNDGPIISNVASEKLSQADALQASLEKIAADLDAQNVADRSAYLSSFIEDRDVQRLPFPLADRIDNHPIFEILSERDGVVPAEQREEQLMMKRRIVLEACLLTAPTPAQMAWAGTSISTPLFSDTQTQYRTTELKMQDLTESLLVADVVRTTSETIMADQAQFLAGISYFCNPPSEINPESPKFPQVPDAYSQDDPTDQSWWSYAQESEITKTMSRQTVDLDEFQADWEQISGLCFQSRVTLVLFFPDELDFSIFKEKMEHFKNRQVNYCLFY